MKKQLKTREDYGTKNAPITWAVISKENVVMTCNFLSQKDAEDFRDNAFFGYYKDCIVKCITARYKGI